MAAGSTQRLPHPPSKDPAVLKEGCVSIPSFPLWLLHSSHRCCFLPSLLKSSKAQSSLSGVTAAWQKQEKSRQQKISFITINMV